MQEKYKFCKGGDLPWIFSSHHSLCPGERERNKGAVGNILGNSVP